MPRFVDHCELAARTDPGRASTCERASPLRPHDTQAKPTPLPLQPGSPQHSVIDTGRHDGPAREDAKAPDAAEFAAH